MLPVRFLIGLIVSGVWLAACTAPPPAPPVIPPTASPQPLPTFTSNASDSAWQVWHVSPAPNAIFSLTAQGDRLWVGTRYGMWQFDLKTRRVVQHDDQLDLVDLVLPIENGQAWASSANGLFFFDGDQWRTVTSPDTRSFSQYQHDTHMLGIDQAGDLWWETSGWRGGINFYRYQGHLPLNGKMEVNQTAISAYPALNPVDCQQWPIFAHIYIQAHRSAEECRALQIASTTVPTTSYGATRLTLDADGSVWRIDRSDNTVSHWSSGTSQPVPLPAGTRISAVASDPIRGIWIGTDRGLAYTAGTELQWLPELDQQFTGGDPIDLVIDPAGAVWVLTMQSALSWLPADRSTTHFEPITNISARSVAAAPGGVWITQGTDLIRLELGEPPAAAAPLPPFGDCKLLHVTSDRAGSVWATTRCGEVWHYQPTASRWTRHVLIDSTSSGREFDPIQTIVAGTDGTVYGVGLAGLGILTAAGEAITATLEPGAATPYATYRHQAVFPAGHPLAPNPNLFFKSQSAADGQGGIWLALINQPELWHYPNGQTTTLAHPLSGKWISELHVDQRGWLWEVGNDQQLAVYDGQAWHTVAMPDLGNVWRIVDSPDGRLWFVGARGLALYQPQGTQP